MKNILFIESSPRGSDSYSHQAARSIVNKLQTRNPGSGIVVRDLGQNPPPHAGMAFGKRNRQFLIHNSRRDFAMKTLFETKSRTEATNAFRLPDDTHVCCVHLRTPDLARALDFYQRVIGFKLIERGESKASLGHGARAHLAGLQ